MAEPDILGYQLCLTETLISVRLYKSITQT